MHFATTRLAGLAAMTLFASLAFGDATQIGESNTDVSGGMQLKWMGKGRTGNILNAEVMLSLGMLSDTLDGKFSSKTSTALVSLDFHPPKILDVKLSMPFLVKQGPDGFTGPFGDMALDICKKWGKNENVATALTVGFPTGYAAIQKTVNGDAFYLDPSNQPGCGLLSSQIRASYMFVPQWGFVNLGGAYWAGLFAQKITDYQYDPTNDKISPGAKGFEAARDGLGATNEAGVLTPDRLNFFMDFGFKTEMLMHSFSIGYSHPMETGKIYNLVRGTTDGGTNNGAYSTKDSAIGELQSKFANTDTTFEVVGQLPIGPWAYLKKYSVPVKTVPYLTLQYNIEKSDMVFPIFLGAMLRLDIDKNVMFGGLTVGLGFKFPVY